MNFLIKTGLIIALIAGGSALAVNKIPSLKANIVSVINPRIKEQALVLELTKHLDDISTSLSEAATTVPSGGATAVAHVIADNKALIAKSQEIIKQISEINDGNSGLISSVVGQLVQVITSTPKPVATPQPIANSEIASSQIANSPTPTATLAPCPAQ